MSIPLHYNKKSLFLPFFILIILMLWYFYGKNMWDLPENIESKLLFLRQSKEITQRDFSLILESMQPKKAQESEILPPMPKADSTKQIETKEEKPKESPKPLQLHAVLNERALINGIWYQVGARIYNDEQEFIVQKITKDNVYLQAKDSKAGMQLEIFHMPEELFLQVRQ